MTIGIVRVALFAARSLRSHRNDDVHLELDQLGRQVGEAVEPSFGPSGLEGDVLPFHVAELAQAPTEGRGTLPRTGQPFWVRGSWR